jgi:RNA polymerase sigma-70 factor (ECF subfamily)
LLLQKLDPEDVVQSAWRSFFVRHGNGEFTLTNWDSLWGLLAIITLRKCGHCAEHFHAACRDVRRESAAAVSSDADVLWEAFALDPTPSQAAILTETVERLMAQLNERERQMLTLCLQGFSVPEISLQVARTQRTVRRLLERVRRWLEQGRCSADMTSAD